MYQRRRARILLAVLVLVALVLITVDFRTGEDGPVDRLRGGLTAVLRPVQDGLATIVRPIGDAAGNIAEIFRVRSENERLRAQVETLRERHRSATDLQRENEELRALLGMRDDGGFETIAATTVALAPSSFEWTITIDAGAEDGVERGMPVINADGLVGRVIQVQPRASRVLLAIDPNFSAAARVARTGEIGPVSGRGGEPMLFEPFDPESSVDVGDEIVTSRYQSGAFPGGIPIGIVASVEEGATPLVREVQVRPFVDFTRLHVVLVVVNAPVEEVPPLTGTEDLEFDPPDVPPTGEPDDDADRDDDAADTEGADT